MKPYAAPTATPVKRRWKWFVAAVLGLVVFSLLVPLAFLLGLHNHRFPAGYVAEDSSTSDPGFGGYEKKINHQVKNLPQDTDNDIVPEGDTLSNTQLQDDVFRPKGLSNTQPVLPKTPASLYKENVNEGDDGNIEAPTDEPTINETKRPCEMKYGSYCLWSVRHKEEFKDFLVKKLKDQLYVARAYYPSVAKLPLQENFTREVKQNIQEHEKMLSEAIVDADLPIIVEKSIQKMEETITKAKSLDIDCINVDKKLTQILDLAEDEARFHSRQGAFLYHLGVQTMPKSLHCLLMRLTVEYFKDPSSHETKIQQLENLEDRDFQHYVVFSKNVLASSVTVNSTIMNAKVSKYLVFHILTDGQNYYAMKVWFSKNSYKDAVIQVLNIENYGVNISHNSKLPYISFSEEFRVSVNDSSQASTVQRKTEYISTFGHTHFLLSDVFKNLKKIVVLDDDVVVQQDLSPLWSLDLKGKVNGAAYFCNVKLGQLNHYLGRDIFDNESCTWMSGLNILDLEKWREHNITSTYEMLDKEMGSRQITSWRAAALPISLLAFQDLTYPLEDTWVLSGLGSDYGIDKNTIKKAAVLHYNGNMKPWLELGVPNYKSYWRKFLTRDNQFMEECNAKL